MVGPPMSMFSINSSGSQARLRGGRLKGIKIHDDQIDGRNLVFGGLRAVARLAAPE